jgi:predicted metal-dependent hydrolase
MSSIAEEAYFALYPDKPLPEMKLRYSAKFNDYNALVRHRPGVMAFSLSKKWQDVERDIQIGLIQSLILKVNKDRQASIQVDMYHIFMKKVANTVEKDRIEQELLESFERVNEGYFNGMFESPNLVFGTESYRKLGSYEYGSDTITISRMLAGHPDLIDYVMHHELLHKKHKFNVRGNRSMHHTKEFRTDEQLFVDHGEMEQRISQLVRKKRWRWF